MSSHWNPLQYMGEAFRAVYKGSAMGPYLVALICLVPVVVIALIFGDTIVKVTALILFAGSLFVFLRRCEFWSENDPTKLYPVTDIIQTRFVDAFLGDEKHKLGITPDHIVNLFTNPNLPAPSKQIELPMGAPKQEPLEEKNIQLL